jgi:hypothetical protein
MLFNSPVAAKDTAIFALQAIMGINASQNLSVETAFNMLRGGSAGFTPAGAYDSGEDLQYVRLNWKRVLWKNVYALNPDYPAGPHTETGTIGA